MTENRNNQKLWEKTKCKALFSSHTVSENKEQETETAWEWISLEFQTKGIKISKYWVISCLVISSKCGYKYRILLKKFKLSPEIRI